MLRGRLAWLALVLWHATWASEMLQVKYRVPEKPSGVYWSPTNFMELEVISEVHCALLAHVQGAAGYTYLNLKCVVVGVDSSSDRTFGVMHFFSAWSVNRAFKRPVLGIRANTYSRSPTAHAVDEFTCLKWSTAYPQCCYVTYLVSNGWIRIDLGAPLKIFGVIVGTIEFGNSEVRVGLEPETGDFSTYELLGQIHSVIPGPGYIKYAKYPSILGRYVSIQLNMYLNLFVCDVLVLADD